MCVRIFIETSLIDTKKLLSVSVPCSNLSSISRHTSTREVRTVSANMKFLPKELSRNSLQETALAKFRRPAAR